MAKLAATVLSIVVEVTDVRAEDICSGVRTSEVVDARYLLVYALHHIAGFNAPYISNIISMTPQGVRQIITRFDSRFEQSGKFFEMALKQIRKRLESI